MKRSRNKGLRRGFCGGGGGGDGGEGLVMVVCEDDGVLSVCEIMKTQICWVEGE